MNEKEFHAYKPSLGLCVTCGRPRREHTGEISVVTTNESSGEQMEKGIYTYREEIFHNKCPHCGCGNEIDDSPETCDQCGKEFLPVFEKEPMAASEKARGRFKARFKNWGK